MAEPIPRPQNPESAKPQSIIVGETAVYLTTSKQITGKEISYITILGAEKRANDGVGSAVPLVKEASRKKGEEGKLIDKPLTNLNDFDEIPWEKVSGVQWTDEQGASHIIPREELALEPGAAGKQETPLQAEPAPSASEPLPDAAPGSIAKEPLIPDTSVPQAPESATTPPEGTPQAGEQPVTEPGAEPVAAESAPEPTPAKGARDILETLTEDPNTITIVGLKAYETRALDLADRSMQKLSRGQERDQASRTLWEKTKDTAHGLHEFVFTKVWKQSIGGIYFHERSRQYYMDMLKTAETPFAEEAIRAAERRATDLYNQKLADANFVVRAGTKTVDWLRDKVGMRTTIQTLALEEIGAMKLKGEIQGLETLDREAKAVRARFGGDFEKADQFVRKQLGEKLEILDPENAEHKPLADGIQSLLKQYASGEIATKAEFDERATEFFSATLKDVRPDIFAEAELYSSSLFDVAETLRTKMSHEAGLANIDEAINAMQIRLGLGTMGEVTSLEPTAVEKGVGKVREVFEWLNRKNVIVPLVFNEATIGSGVAIALSAVNFLKTAPFKAVASITGPLGSLTGGALAGGIFAGWREYGQLHKDYLTHLREKESGATFTETQKKRAWFEKFAVKQRRADEMIASVQSSLYEGDALKSALTDDELRASFATIADLHARKAVSETGPKRIGLVQYSGLESIETERAVLDITANRALSDLESYLTSHTEQAEIVLGGNTFPEFMEKLTVTQTQVLREGVQTLDAVEDPIKLTLGLVSSYAPEADIIRRRWPLASKALAGEEKAMGLDAILEEFKTEARVEAIKYGVKAGAVGAALGAAFQGIAALGRTDAVVEGPAEFSDKAAATATAHIDKLSPPDGNHIVSIGPDQLHQTVYNLPKELIITPHTNETGDVVYSATLDQSLVENLKGEHDILLGENLPADKLIERLEDIGLTVKEPIEPGSIAAKSSDIPDLVTKYNDAVPAQIPDGYKFSHIAPAGQPDSWNLLNAKGETVATGLDFKPDGSLANADEVQKQLTEHGLNLDTSATVTIRHPNSLFTPDGKIVPNTPVAPEIGFTPTPMEIKGSELQEGGIWDYFLDKSKGENPMATTNGLKNLFRMHTYGQENHNIIVPDTHGPDYELPLRDATFGDHAVKELDLTRIPADASIQLPKEAFGENGIEWFTNKNDEAISHLNEIVAAGHVGDQTFRGPMDAINYLYNSKDEAEHLQGIILKLGYVGQDNKLPTEADVAVLMKAMGTPEAGPLPVTPEGVPVDPVVVHPIKIFETPPPQTPGEILASGPLEIPYTQETTVLPGANIRELPWMPIFIPYREVLEAAPVEALATGPVFGESLVSPFGYEEAFINRETLDKRKSPRLTENPAAALNEHEEIDWYISALSPEETAVLEELKAQENPPMNPETRAIVTIPLVQNGGTIYQRLTNYMTQTNADGSPIDPKHVEYVVYDAQIAPPEGAVNEILPADIKGEIDRFKADHPDAQIVYATRTYTEPPTSGRIKRDMSNLVLSRLSGRPAGSLQATIIADNSTVQSIKSSYIASVIETLDANPTVDLVSGTYQLPQEAYASYPMLFAHHRAFEVLDSFVRHGDANGVPAVFQGNLGVRAGTLAAIGGYNGDSPLLEERELAWMVSKARQNPDVAQTVPAMAATMDPKETVFMQLQQLGLAEPSVPLANNEVYKDMTWQEMAAKASETYTQEHLEKHLTNMYANMYPSLKANNPERFETYFGRTMNALGLSYELKDGSVTLTDMTNLEPNMKATPDIEAFAKAAAPEIVAATPKAAETPREQLEAVAGEQPETPIETQPSEPMASSIASAEVVAQPENASAQETPQAPETLPEGIDDRINFVLNKSAEQNSASVQISTGELMDYVKTSIEIPMARITGGKISIQGNTVKLNEMVAKTPVGDAHFAGTLVTDPAKGLVVDKNSIDLKLPLLARPWSKTIHNSIDNFNRLVLDHLDSRISTAWKAERIDVSGDKLEVRFAKKPATK